MNRNLEPDFSRELTRRGLEAAERLRVPESPKWLVFRGKCLVLLGDLDAGCQLFDRCVASYPDAIFGRIDSAICALRDPDLRDAQEAAFERALELSVRPEHANAAAKNLEEHRRWKASGYAGQFQGTIVY